MQEENNLVPQLRFPEFKGGWEKLIYNDIFSFNSTNSYSRIQLNYKRGLVKNIHYGDIHTKFPTIFDINKEQVPFINPDIEISNIKEENYCQDGDLVIADASEDYNDIGKTIEIVNLNDEKVVAGLHTFLARPKLKMALGFSGYMLQYSKVRKQIMTIAQGTKVLSLSTSRLGKINLKIPSLPEQQKIAQFLTAVDTRIQNLEKRRELLEQYKKGVMQKIFKQELRFKDDGGKEFPDWEFKNGNRLFKSISDKNHNSDLPILAITQDQGAIPRHLIDYNIGVTAKSVSSYKIVQVGDFIISLRSFQGGIEYSYYKGICSPAYIILRPAAELNRDFYKFYLKTSSYIQELTKKLEGIRDGKMISYKYFSEIKLPYPSLEEQQKIANFLLAIDEKITVTTQKIEQSKTYKKGLLQKMFV
ncbi:restriction endonuclease subunit S [Salegentibacter mishustinae]|uniref:restriction endonuclease subunit S n=1 Tax=Salegentibacter mishustinae TaxID=270918 RepID=UPI001CE1023A|nr:restriction endonuclease subunit S [Salegentibacter mishustinae]UBZ08142.1 restriction endonuclease subunit S [Salegentibacter mishustinae]